MTDDLLKIVSLADPAIDHVATPQSGYTAYLSGDFDLTLLTFKSDPQPTYFYLRQIPHETMALYVRARPTVEGQAVAAFRASVMRVENAMLKAPRPHARHAMQRASAPWMPAAVREGKRIADMDSLMTEDEVAQFDYLTVLEIGWQAERDSGFFLQGTAARLPVPQLLLQIWQEISARESLSSAVQEKSTVETGPTG